MKQILYASFFAAAAALGLSSCMNGDYDANPATTSTGVNPLTPTGGSGGSGGGGSNGSFNWNGTDPMSAKVNGAGWQAANYTYVPPIQGFAASVSGTNADKESILVNIPNNPTINTTYSFGSNLSASYSIDNGNQDPNNVYGAGLGTGGQVQILEDDATHIKGKFYFNAKNVGGASRNVTEGYFNVLKK